MTRLRPTLLAVRAVRLGLAFIGAVLVLAARPAHAQINPILEAHHVEYHGDAVRPAEVLPARPVVLAPDQTAAYTGLDVDLSGGAEGKIWTVPIGASMGVLRSFEAGLDAVLVPKPLDGASLVGTTRLYGRYLVLENELAAEVGLFLPTALSGQTGLELVVPARYRAGHIELFGEGRAWYRSGNTRRDVYLGGSVTGLFSFTDALFAVAEVGVSYWTYKFEGFNRVNNLIMPLGLGAGYRLGPDLFVKASFLLRDLASQDAATNFDGFSRRELSVMLVQQVDLSPSSTERRTPGERRAE
jgi:hypothetical protein